MFASFAEKQKNIKQNKTKQKKTDTLARADEHF